MMHRSRLLLTALAFALVVGTAAAAEKADAPVGLEKGSVELTSGGPLAFGPQGVLFAADPKAATIYAIDTGDRAAPAGAGRPMVARIGQKIAEMLGTDTRSIRINDLAVNPLSGNTYLSVSRGSGRAAMPILLRVGRDGKISEFSTKEVRCAKAELPDAPGPDAVDRRRRPLRIQSITDLAYIDGRVIVAGLSNEEWSSSLRSIPFPFKETDKGASVGIYHGAHGQFETASPVRTFVPYDLEGRAHLLAAYTCTPLVKFPVADLKPGTKVKGTTVAELGNRNNPLDMIVYKKGGTDYLLIANSSRGVMKLPAGKIKDVKGITERVPRGDTAGVKYETIDSLQGVVQMDAFDKDHALVLIQNDDGQTLKTVELP